MLTTKKLAQIFLIFSLATMVVASGIGCAPAGARALVKGERLLKEGKYSEAVQKFEEAAKAYPHSAKAWNYLGLGYQYSGDQKKAAQAYQQALALDRNLTAARYNLGALYLEQNFFPAAISELTTFTQLEPNNADGWMKLGLAQLQLASSLSGVEKNRQLDAAKKNFDSAQKLRPSAETLNAIGLLQMQRGRPRDAIPSFTSALQQQPDYAPAALNLAVVYHQHLNERHLALLNYRKFLSVAKQAPEVAQVQKVVRQLENDLNPSVVVASAPPTAKPPATLASKGASPSNAAPTKTETNFSKTTSKAPPIISSPKAQPSPRREAHVEVTKLPDEPPLKSAPDVPAIENPAPLSTSSEPPPRTFNRAPLPEKGAGTLTKINPANWFKRKPKQTPPSITELPATRPSIEKSAEVSERTPTEKKQRNVATTRTTPTFPRYKYRMPSKPPEGKREEAEPFFSDGMQAQKDRRMVEALAAYRQAVKLDPSFYEAHYNMALAAHEVRELSAALAAYEQALAILPESVNARYNFAFTLQEAGYFHDAENELQKLLAQNPNETRAHLLLGNLCAQRLNQISNAREHYLKVLEAEPQHPQATQIRYWLAAHS